MFTRLFLVLALLVCEHEVIGGIFKMTARDNSDVIEMMKPLVSEVSKSIADAVTGGEELESALTGIITKHLVRQTNELKELTKSNKGNQTDELCCICNHCQTFCVSCDCYCCCEGDHGCKCFTCGSTGGNVVMVDEVGKTFGTSIKLWADSSKTLLRADVTRSVVAITKATDSCCFCSQCRQKSHIGDGTYCVDGNDCTCTRCSTNKVDLIAASIWNPISLKPEAETVIERVDSLIDRLTLYLS